MKTPFPLLMTGAALLMASTALAQDIAIAEGDVKLGQKHYSPYLDQSYPNRVFWGDTHVHTSYSTDAGMIGNRLGPDEAFRFARGEKVRASAGEYAQLIRPLDFLVVADHAENLGLAPMIEESNPALLALPWVGKCMTWSKKGSSTKPTSCGGPRCRNSRIPSQTMI